MRCNSLKPNRALALKPNRALALKRLSVVRRGLVVRVLGGVGRFGGGSRRNLGRGLSQRRVRAQRVLENAPQRFYAVFPPDLLPFFVGAAVIRNANLVNPELEPGNLNHHLRLKPESVLLEPYR